MTKDDALEEIKRINRLPLTHEDAIRKMKQEVRLYAKDGGPIVDSDGEIHWPLQYRPDGSCFYDSFRLLFWLFEDEIVERLESEIRSTPERADALSLRKRVEAIRNVVRSVQP